MKIISLVAVFVLICSVSYTQSVAVAQLDPFTLTINPGASDGDSQNPINPANITIPAGATVIWLNKDSVYHQIVSGTSDKGPTNIFYGDFFGPNEAYNVTFDTAGVFDYYDPIWTNIKGHIVATSENNTGFNTNNINSESNQPLNNQAPIQDENSNTAADTSNTILNQPQTGIIGENSTIQAQDQQIQPQQQVQDQTFQPLDNQVPIQNDDSQTQTGIIGENPTIQAQDQQIQTVQDQPVQPVQQQFQIPQHGDIDSFKATGTIHSYIVTPASPWNATGDWTLIVEDGEVISFITNMAWFNGTTGHTHDFLNFDSSSDVELPADNILTIDGEMDVASNGVVTWDEVESSINIGGGGRTITINVDHDETDHHFAGQPIVGTVNSLTPCSDSPGPSMEILPTCS
ncbi:MAG TPA: hypothetical protein VJR94_09145 [Candidatus Nitrosocosmicus sp.]|nr:hypothetical protein [Candidatus Nitrosocosmicus sp.]